jgi:glycosyltransferase involved in cell wall biosynthesis
MTPPFPARVGYVVKRYPRFSETFIVNEILAHEAMGREIDIFALRSVEESHFQDILARVRAGVTRVPERVQGADQFWEAMQAGARVLPGFWDALARFPEAAGEDVLQATFVAAEARRRGLAHLHAHFGTVAATVARIAAALAGISWSMTLHAKDIYCAYEEDHHLDLKLRDSAGAVTVSDYNLRFLAERFPSARARTVRIYNGIDLADFPWTTPAAGADEILAVGRLVEKKGFHVLIEAVRILATEGRRVRCRIVGAGEEEADLAAQIAASGLDDRVTLAGPMPQGEVKAAMRGAATLACPCVVGGDGNRDGLPTVLLEAMALGLPCVGSDVTGIPGAIDDGQSGLIAPEGDAVALARAIARLLDDPGLRARLSTEARRVVERDFDISRNVPELGALFERCVAARDGMPALRGVA